MLKYVLEYSKLYKNYFVYYPRMNPITHQALLDDPDHSQSDYSISDYSTSDISSILFKNSGKFLSRVSSTW